MHKEKIRKDKSGSMHFAVLICCLWLWPQFAYSERTPKDNPNVLRITTGFGLLTEDRPYTINTGLTPVEDETETEPSLCFEGAYQNVEVTCGMLETTGLGLRFRARSRSSQQSYSENSYFSFYPAVSWHNPAASRSDYRVFSGMQTRSGGFVPGLGAELGLNFLYLKGSIWSGALGKSGGSFGRVVFGVQPWLGRAAFKIGLGLERLSTRYATYYYGVKAEEATSSRPAYALSPATSRMLVGELFFPFSNRFSLDAKLQYTVLDTEIFNSPLIEDETELKLMVYLQYNIYLAQRGLNR